MQAIRNAFKGLVRNTWAGLRISPELLADSAKTPAEKERLAAARVDSYMDRLVQGQEGFIDVPPPLAEALREKYDGSVKQAGLTRAIELATRTRAAADSSKAAGQPKSAVPMPDTSANKR
jgi:peptidyl-prolyl cis-trans isomerase D